MTVVLWSKFMDVDETGPQMGLVDSNGQARPAWHAFHFYALMPEERVVWPLLHDYSTHAMKLQRRFPCRIMHMWL